MPEKDHISHQVCTIFLYTVPLRFVEISVDTGSVSSPPPLVDSSSFEMAHQTEQILVLLLLVHFVHLFSLRSSLGVWPQGLLVILVSTEMNHLSLMQSFSVKFTECLLQLKTDMCQMSPILLKCESTAQASSNALAVPMIQCYAPGLLLLSNTNKSSFGGNACCSSVDIKMNMSHPEALI